MIAVGLSLVTFWCGVAVVGVLGACSFAASESEIRRRLRECERLEQERRRGRGSSCSSG